MTSPSENPAATQPPPAPRQRRRLRIALLCAVVFLAGGVAGAGLAVGVGKRAVRGRLDATRWAGETMRRFDRRLHLEPAQRERIEPIVRDMTSDMRRIGAEAAAAWAATIADGSERVRSELTPEQQKEFDRLTSEMRERWARRVRRPLRP